MSDTYGVSNHEALQGLISTDEPRNVRIDKSTRAQTTIEYAHHEIHGGDSYTFADSTDVAASTDIDYVITTPNTAKWAHLTHSIYTEAEGELQIYENCTPTTDGTSLTVVNRNRNSQNSAAVTVQRIPTLATPGTLLQTIHFGTGKTVGSESRETSEFILKPNEDYLFRMVNATSSVNYMTIKFDWYEHTDLT